MIKINDNTIVDIACPVLCCHSCITIEEIKDLCPELYPKYENLLLQITLNTMKDIISCPQISCKCPLIKNSDDALAICNKCDYVFCIYCYKVHIVYFDKQMQVNRYI